MRVECRVSCRGSLVVAGQRIHVGIAQAGVTLTVETADTTFRVHDGDQFVTEVPRTTTKPIAGFKVCKPNLHAYPAIMRRVDSQAQGEAVTIRDEVQDFCRHGTLPSEQDDSEDAAADLEEREQLLHAITPPVTDEEARLLTTCFGDDNCFGLAWTLLHLVESAPTPAVTSEPPEHSNPWIMSLWIRYRNTLAG